MKQEKIIYLPSTKEDEISINKVIYEEKNFIETINEISLKLGAKKQITDQKSFLLERPYRVQPKKYSHTYHITDSPSKTYKPFQRTNPRKYEFYSREDQIIKSLLSIQFSTWIIDRFYNKKEEVIYENFNFSNEFCFWDLYQYLEKNKLLNDFKYLEILKEYLKIFKIIKTKNTVTEEDFKKKYSSATRKNWVSRDAFRLQTQIAQANSKVLSLKKY